MISNYYLASKMEAEYILTKSLINKALSNYNYSNAIEECYNWADIVANKFGFSYNKNWKLFKKKLVGKYFGSPPFKCFSRNQQSLEDFKIFKKTYANSKLRMTIHKHNEACHSKSIALINGDEIKHFLWAIKELGPQDYITVFPESSGPYSICFRCAISNFGQDIYYEAGFGQAYLTFENERGLHPIASVHKNKSCGKCSIIGVDSLKMHIYKMIEDYEYFLTSKMYCMCQFLGMDYIAIEGYYNYKEKTRPIIVDCDLPFDKVFFKRI